MQKKSSVYFNNKSIQTTQFFKNVKRLRSTNLNLLKINDMAETKKVKEKAKVNEDKLKAHQLTMDKMDKTYGKGSVMKLGDGAVEDVVVIPSGSVTLDIALGVGGYPK